MSDFHQPRRGDKFWDGQVLPQHNGEIIHVDWRSAADYDDKTVIVKFHDSYHRASYTFGEIKHCWDERYNLYRLNIEDHEGGFHRSDEVDGNIKYAAKKPP